MAAHSLGALRNELRLWGNREALMQAVLSRRGIDELATLLERCADIDRLAKGLRAARARQRPVDRIARSGLRRRRAAQRAPGTSCSRPSMNSPADLRDDPCRRHGGTRPARARRRRADGQGGNAHQGRRIAGDRRRDPRAARRRSRRRTRATSTRARQRPGRRRARPPDARRRARRADGAGTRADRATARPDRRDRRRAAEPSRHPGRPDARAARRHRHHLREPAERDGRCGRPVPQERQRDDPARRLGSDREQPRAGADRRDGARRGAGCRGRRAAGRHDRPRRRRPARHHARVRRRDRAARRQGPDRAADARDRACR